MLKRQRISKGKRCSKAIARGVSTEMTTTDVLHNFEEAGVIVVYRCSREVNKVPTESVTAYFAGLALRK